MKKAAPIIIVVAVLVIAGGAFALMKNKNNSSSSASDSSTSGMNMQKSTNDSSQSTATNQVSISDFAFSPANITVKKGTTVTWTNHDSVAHTVVETDGKTGPQSSSLANGKSYSFTFNTTGTFKYNCSIHPEMVGTVTVTE